MAQGHYGTDKDRKEATIVDVRSELCQLLDWKTGETFLRAATMTTTR